MNLARTKSIDFIKSIPILFDRKKIVILWFQWQNTLNDSNTNENFSSKFKLNEDEKTKSRKYNVHQ